MGYYAYLTEKEAEEMKVVEKVVEVVLSPMSKEVD